MDDTVLDDEEDKADTVLDDEEDEADTLMMLLSVLRKDEGWGTGKLIFLVPPMVFGRGEHGPRAAVALLPPRQGGVVAAVPLCVGTEAAAEGVGWGRPAANLANCAVTKLVTR